MSWTSEATSQQACFGLTPISLDPFFVRRPALLSSTMVYERRATMYAGNFHNTGIHTLHTYVAGHIFPGWELCTPIHILFPFLHCTEEVTNWVSYMWLPFQTPPTLR